MILLTRLNGTAVGVNADLIEKVEPTPDTVITLVDGTKYVVAEDPEGVVTRIVEFRARVLRLAEQMAADAGVEPFTEQIARVADAVEGVGRPRSAALRLVVAPDRGPDAGDADGLDPGDAGFGDPAGGV